MQTPCVIPNGARFVTLYGDRHSGYLVAFLCNTKGIAHTSLTLLDQYFRTIPTKTPIRFGPGTILHGDNEMDCKPWLKEMAQFQISLDCCPTHTPVGNSWIERKWQTIFDGVRATLHQFNLNLDLWGLSVLHQIYIMNNTPDKNNVSPTELLTGYPHDVTFLKSLPAFGTPSFAHVQTTRQKLDPKSREGGIFVGVNQRNTTFNIFHRDTKTVVSTQSASFTQEFAKPPTEDLSSTLQTLLPFFEDMQHGSHTRHCRDMRQRPIRT